MSAPRWPSLGLYLSHLLLPVVHGLSVLRAAGRWTLAQPSQTQAAPLLLLLVQNLVLGRKRKWERLLQFGGRAVGLNSRESA